VCNTQPCYREFKQDATYNVLPLVGYAILAQDLQKNKIHLKTLVVFWKMTVYQSIYTVLVLLPLCKFCTQVMLSLLIAKNTVNAHPVTGHEGPEGQWRYTSTLYLSLVLDGVGGQCHAPTTLPLGNDLVPIVQKAGLAPGPVWMCEKYPSHWDPRTVQPIVCHCTNYIIMVHNY